MKSFVSRSEQVDARNYNSYVDQRWRALQANFDSDQPQFFKSDTFGPAHSESLKVLRHAQIALAKAWTTENSDEQSDLRPAQTANVLEVPHSSAGTEGHQKGASEKPADHSTSYTQDHQAGDFDQWGNPEEETQLVIALARRRREQNDRDFKRTKASLTDLISKLDAVTDGMNQVHKESLRMWGAELSTIQPTEGEPSAF